GIPGETARLGRPDGRAGPGDRAAQAARENPGQRASEHFDLPGPSEPVRYSDETIAGGRRGGQASAGFGTRPVPRLAARGDATGDDVLVHDSIAETTALS